MRTIFWIFIGCAISSNAFGEDPIQQRLDQLYAEYEALSASPTIKKYVALDGKLRAFIVEELPIYDHSVKIEKEADYYKYDNNRTRALGIETSKYAMGKYSLALVYSEKFLVQAHEIDPHSKYREYTLFSQIMGIRPSHGLGEMPDIKIVYQYAKEFPNGPFIAKVYEIIAGFHKDLFMVVRNLSKKKQEIISMIAISLMWNAALMKNRWHETRKSRSDTTLNIKRHWGRMLNSPRGSRAS